MIASRLAYSARHTTNKHARAAKPTAHESACAIDATVRRKRKTKTGEASVRGKRPRGRGNATARWSEEHSCACPHPTAPAARAAPERRRSCAPPMPVRMRHVRSADRSEKGLDAPANGARRREREGRATSRPAASDRAPVVGTARLHGCSFCTLTRLSNILVYWREGQQTKRKKKEMTGDERTERRGGDSSGDTRQRQARSDPTTPALTPCAPLHRSPPFSPLLPPLLMRVALSL